MDRLIDPNFERGRKDQRTADSVKWDAGTHRRWNRSGNARINERLNWSEFEKKFRDPRTAGLVQIFKGDSGIHRPPIWSKFLKGNAGIHGRSIGPNF